ncbi:MAG: hypothetical protein HKN45_06480, partial [Flavobacteriales bacterium]|nr:hypothetical protein [Flavobacteriales bacterium]
QASTEFKKGNWQGFVSAYAEQDARNQPLQQELDDFDRAILGNTGDDINSAFSSSLDTVPFSEDQVLYALVDSLGFDSVFVFSTVPDLARYQVSFTRVGDGMGDYVEEDFTANGRVYKWVAPDTMNGQIVPQGDYVPGILLITPKKQQLYSAGLRYDIGKNTWMDIEGALSNEDLNTFSKFDSEDNIGTAFRWRGGSLLRLDSLSSITLGGLVEFTQRDFEFIERYRAVEFERNWNIDEATLQKDQIQTRVDIGFDKGVQRKVVYALDRFAAGSSFSGVNQELKVNWNTEEWRVRFNGSLLESRGDRRTRFERHISDISRDVGHVRIGFRDDRENNDFFLTGDSLSTASYRWYEWEAYIAASDTSSWNYRLFFKNRDDWRPSDTKKLRAAHAEEYGLELSNAGSRKHRLKLVSAWRSLEIVRDEIIDSEPEETFLGRLEYRGRALNGVLNLNSFYEVGSGLERRRQFIYLEVPAGQGVYVWVDYDGDGVRDLDEFEIAQFQYEADFIRVFTPTDAFEKTFTNQVAQNLSIDPAKVWRAKEGWRRFVARFSDQASWRADRKTNEEEGSQAFNPFLQDLNDTVLVALNNSFRNSIFFNKTDPVWGLDHRYSDVKNKQLLTNGFESRSSRENSLNARYTLDRRYTLRITAIENQRSREASYSSNRDFVIDELSLMPSVEWQPDRTFRLTLSGELTDRDNRIGDGEKASISRLGAEAKWSQLDKGSLNFNFDYVSIDYNGNENSSLAFEMLDGLRSGNNFTWSFFMQRNLAKNLALNITYNGRKSEDTNTIHSGGVQIRAFF